MTSRPVIALAFVAALGSAGFLAVRANAQQPTPPQADQQAPAAPRLSAEDRAAFLDARLAAVKAGLKLTPDQEKLWPPVEQAVRDSVAKMMELRQQSQAQTQPADPFERMRQMADMATTRAETLHKIVDAGQLLYASLSDEQKHRLGFLMRRRGGERQGMGQNRPGPWNRDTDRPGQRQDFGGPRGDDSTGAPRDERGDDRSGPRDRDHFGSREDGGRDFRDGERFGQRDHDRFRPRWDDRRYGHGRDDHFGDSQDGQRHGDRDDRDDRRFGPRHDGRDFNRRDFDRRDFSDHEEYGRSRPGWRSHDSDADRDDDSGSNRL